MNLILNTYKIRIIFFGLLCLCTHFINAQKQIALDEPGIPLIQKYTFPNYCISTGKVSVYEDASGIFLMGSKNKLIVFYGNEFGTINLKGQINISANQKSIFYTGYNSLGLIKLFKNNEPKLIPIIDETKVSNNAFGQINNVFVINELIIFNNDKKLFQFDGTDFTAIDSSRVKIQMFRIKDSVYVHKFESGLYLYFMGNLVRMPNGEKFAGKDIESMLPYNDDFLIKLKGEPNFIILTKQGKLITKTFGFETYVEKAGFADAIMLPGNRMAIATKSAGILIYSFAFDYIQKVGMNEGLANNTATQLHLDKAGNLWVIHDIGLSRIELNFPITQYGNYAGVSGNIYDIYKFKNNLYLGTSNGLLKGDYKNISGTTRFRRLFFTKVEGIINECNKLVPINNQLLAITPTGIYDVKNNEATLIYSTEINSFDCINNTIFCTGNENGLEILSYLNGHFTKLLNSSVNNQSVSELVCENEHSIWIRTSSNQLLRADYNIQSNFLTLKKISGTETKNTDNLPFYLLKTNNGVRFCYNDSVVKFNIEKNIVETDNKKGKQLNGILWYVEIANDKSKNSLFQISNPMENLKGILMFNTNAGNSFKPYFFNTGSLKSPIYVDSSSTWIGGDYKLLQFDNSKTYNAPRKHFAIIKRVIIGQDSILLVGLDDPEISYRYNDLKFQVASTSFEGEPFVKYKYILEGKNNNWSEWNKNPEITFNNLHAGNYKLLIRTLNVDGTLSGTTEFGFSILPPFYQTIPAYIIYLLVFLFVIFIVMRYRTWRFLQYKESMERIVMERTEEILKEKEKSEILIANLLPKGTADELKLTGKATSQKFSMVTVLFSDIEGFTKIAEQMNPDLLIDQLDTFFFHFDMVVEKYNIEKIKTIGDAYMCAGGIPNKNITNPVEVVLAAMEVQEYMRELKSKNADIWDLRIGIHTGSVIAGVVGHKKMSYDIWGDTVNTASRMESSGEAGKVNISGHTYELIKEFFICEHRGKMPVKYKGDIDMYFVKCIRPELAVDMKLVPNKRFLLMLQLLRLQDVEEEVLERLNKDLPSNLYFHNAIRTKEIYSLVDLFGRAEALNDEENLLLRTAALLQDLGYIVSYDNHEDESIKLANEILPQYKYTPEQIEKITELIDASKRLRKPQNKMEEIILDADMNYLSRADFVTLNDSFYMELLERDKISSKDDWDKMQIVLLSNHKYYTAVANMLRDVNPEQQAENLINSTQKSDPS